MIFLLCLSILAHIPPLLVHYPIQVFLLFECLLLGCVPISNTKYLPKKIPKIREQTKQICYCINTVCVNDFSSLFINLSSFTPAATSLPSASFLLLKYLLLRCVTIFNTKISSKKIRKIREQTKQICYCINTVCINDFPSLFINLSSYTPAATSLPNTSFFTSLIDATFKLVV